MSVHMIRNFGMGAFAVVLVVSLIWILREKGAEAAAFISEEENGPFRFGKSMLMGHGRNQTVFLTDVPVTLGDRLFFFRIDTGEAFQFPIYEEEETLIGRAALEKRNNTISRQLLAIRKDEKRNVQIRVFPGKSIRLLDRNGRTLRFITGILHMSAEETLYLGIGNRKFSVCLFREARECPDTRGKKRTDTLVRPGR